LDGGAIADEGDCNGTVLVGLLIAALLGEVRPAAVTPLKLTLLMGVGVGEDDIGEGVIRVKSS